MRTKDVLGTLAAGMALLFGFATANAAVVATGTISDLTISQGDIAIYITAAAGSPCGSGWFYSYDSDSDQSTVNRLLSILETASATGESVTIYNTTVTCTSGRFGSANLVTNSG